MAQKYSNEQEEQKREMDADHSDGEIDQDLVQQQRVKRANTISDETIVNYSAFKTKIERMRETIKDMPRQ